MFILPEIVRSALDYWMPVQDSLTVLQHAMIRSELKRQGTLRHIVTVADEAAAAAAAAAAAGPPLAVTLAMRAPLFVFPVGQEALHLDFGAVSLSTSFPLEQGGMQALQYTCRLHGLCVRRKLAPGIVLSGLHGAMIKTNKEIWNVL